MNRPSGTPVRRVIALAGALLLMGVGACTNDTDQSDPAPSPTPLPGATTGAAPTLEAKPVPMRVEIVEVAGRLSKKSRAALERNVGRTVGNYFDDAHLGGEYPRDSFRYAFSTFSAGATRQARGDIGFLTNARLGPSTTTVVPRRKDVRLYVLSPNRVAAGVTARIHLVYVADRDQGTDQRVRVTGRLLLTRKQSGGWEIFGYDVARAATPVARGGAR